MHISAGNVLMAIYRYGLNLSKDNRSIIEEDFRCWIK